MCTRSRRISLVAAALFLLGSAVRAQAVEYLCGDICQCWVGCTRRCTDDISGYSTTCGAADYACNGQCLVAAAPHATGPAAVSLLTPSDGCQDTPTPESSLDALALR